MEITTEDRESVPNVAYIDSKTGNVLDLCVILVHCVLWKPLAVDANDVKVAMEP